jgi:hypothetical protein
MIRAFAYRRLAVAALISACLFPAATTASAQELMPHMESCLEWAHSDGQWGAVNSCNEPTTILFMWLADGRMITQDVSPGGRFSSGAAEPVGTNAWMYTACAVGYAPSVRFSADNADIIVPSHYHCVRQGRPGA